jgi:hypothetical protein
MAAAIAASRQWGSNRFQQAKVLELSKNLALGPLALCIPLANFVARVTLAYHVNSTATTNDLAIRVTKLQGTDGGYNFHDFLLRLSRKWNLFFGTEYDRDPH